MEIIKPDLKNQEIANWYAIYTKPRAEKKVFERLVMNGYDAYIPLVESISQWSDRKKKISQPLIPSFVFVKIEREKLFETLKVNGTKGILRHIGKPAIVRDYEIENLKILLSDTEKFEKVDKLVVKKGEAVEVVSGPFLGLKGYSVNLQGKHRLVVEIQALGSNMIVNVPLDFVRKSTIMN